MSMSEHEYQRLIRKYPSLAAKLHICITVRRVAGSGYTVAATFDADGEIFTTLPQAQEARRALIYRELLATEYGYL